jgi:hypothetical protein
MYLLLRPVKRAANRWKSPLEAASGGAGESMAVALYQNPERDRPQANDSRDQNPDAMRSVLF